MSPAPAQTWPPELLLRAQGMRVLLLDVDGVLTDGGLYYGAEGDRHHDGSSGDAHPGGEVLAASDLALAAGLFQAPLGCLLRAFAAVGVAHLVTPSSIRTASSAIAETTPGSTT